LLKAEGEINQALKLLEPVELNPYELAEQFKAIKDDKHSSNVSTVPINPGFKEILMDEHQRNQFAQKLHLATQLMVESRQKHGRIIIERYNLVLSIQKHNEAVRYELGRYFESLYSDIKEKKINEEFQIRGSNSNQVSSNPNTVSSLGLSSGSSYSFDDSSSYLHFALRSYILSLKNHNLNMITQALPRMLTLWFSFTSLRDDSANSSNRKSSSGLSPLVKVQREVNTLIAAGAVKISAYTWFHCMPQLVSRIGHNNPGTVEIIQSILLRILVEYPKQGVWHIAGLLHSLNDERVEVGRQLVKQACEGLVQSERKGEAEMLRQASRLFEELDKLASFQTKEKRIRYSLGEGISLTHFLVPSQQTLLNLPVPVDQGQETKESLLYYQSNHHYIQNFHDIVEVAASKARPKIIQLTTTAGKTVKFLLKQEKNGDLRKDARMMEFNSVINRILVEDAEGRKRDLRLRTYAVVCLNEECGLLEWVNNTSCLRHLIIESHGFFKNMEYPFLNPKDVINSLHEIKTL
jgi:serine/threonine-protein kinase ATR